MSDLSSVKKILILSANPKGTTQLRLDQEVREIKNGLRRAKRREQFVIESAEAVRYRDIRRAILDYEPQILHFSGHGAGEEGLVFEDETGQKKLVDAEALAELFELFSDQLECVVLNACYSEVQGREIARHINYVVGMNQAIGDKAAIEFAIGFYDALGAGKSYEVAYKFGCSAIALAGIPEKGTPQLLTTEDLACFSSTPSFYIERPPIEQNCYQAIMEPGALLRIKAPAKMGKTLLLAKILDYGNQQNYKTVKFDFQLADPSVLTDLKTFLQWFCVNVADSLDLNDNLDKYWRDIYGLNKNCTRYFQKYLLSFTLSAAIFSGILARKEVLQVESKVKDLQDKAEKFENQAQKAQKKEQDAQKELSKVNEVNNSLQKKAKELEQEIQNKEIEIINVTQELDQVNQQALEAKTEAREAKTKAREAQAEAREAKKEYQELLLNAQEVRQQKKQLENEKEEIIAALQKLEEKDKNVFMLAKLTEQLEQQSKGKADQIRNNAILSYGIQDNQLREAFMLSNISLAYQNLGAYREAEEAITNSLNLLGKKTESDISTERFVVFLHALNTEGRLFIRLFKSQNYIQKTVSSYEKTFTLLQTRNDIQKAVSSYEKAFTLLQTRNSKPIVINNLSLKALTRENVLLVYRGLMESLLLQSNRTEVNKQNNLERVIQLFEALQLSELSNFLQKDNPLQITPLTPLDEILVQIDKIDSTAAIIYTIILEDSLAVILKLPGKENLTHHITKISQEDVANNLNELIERLRDRTRYSYQVQEYSQKVYEWIIRPLEEKLQENNIENLVFVLDGILRNIPMAVLYDQNEQKYLIEKYAIALAPSLQLLDPKPIEPRQINVLAAGLSEGRELEQRPFKSLEYVDKELKRIQEVVPASYELLNENFDYQQLQAQLKTNKYNVAHFATHGEFNSDPDQTFIVLSDRLLNIRDLDDLLRVETGTQPISIELLVLSACETAFGDNRANLGFAGVAVRAGARSTLATLWSVGDESTAELMSKFYHQLINTEGINKAEALQKAQIEFLHDEKFHDKQWDRPYYWASFVLLGNWL